MPDTSVKYFASTMSGAPTLSNVAGDLIGVLDACLVNGFGSVTLDSLVIASNVATGTISTGHNLAMVGNTGPVITIAGATPSGLNGEWRLASVPGTTTFTFATSGITDQTATGTITAKRSPAGFSKAFSGTNKAAYRSDNIAGTRLYLRVYDAETTAARIVGYETMSDVDTGTGPFPTEAQLSGGLYCRKGSTSSRPWALYSDGRMIYFHTFYSTSTEDWTGGLVFGDIFSYLSPDAYACLLLGSSSSSGTMVLSVLANTTGGYLARSYTQVGESIASARQSHNLMTNIGVATQAYPAPVDQLLHAVQVDVWEGTDTLVRGLLPGLWAPMHNSSLGGGLIFDDIPNLPGRTLITQRIAASSAPKSLMDITGPWR